MNELVLPPLWTWREFLAAATAPPTTAHGLARCEGADEDAWAGCSWEEAVQLGRDGWPQPLREVDVTVAELRERAGIGAAVTVLVPSWDVAGAEVDIGAYQSGIPECMIEATPVQVSRRGKVVTFVIPMSYSGDVPHEHIINRGLALTTLCAAIIEAGHSVEIWSGNAGMIGTARKCAMVRVIAAGEPFDVGRLIFATAHPAMLRRLAFGMWDAQRPDVATALVAGDYGRPPFDVRADDLPAGITDPYLFPYLAADDTQWSDLDQSLEWCHDMFVRLGLLSGIGTS